MAVAGMHIRHDWQTFVDWEQKSVRTLCGKTSASHLAGIPGVTDQPDVIEVKNKKVYGWCTTCARLAMGVAENALSRRLGDIHPYILPMYQDVYLITFPIYLQWQARQGAW